MGVRIQELPETTGINKEDVLIVEDGQGTKKGTVKQLDETLGVSQLKEDLDELYSDNYVQENIFTTNGINSTYTNNTSAVYNGDGTITIGVDDYGTTMSDGSVVLSPGEYYLYGAPFGISFISTEVSYSNAIVKNTANHLKRFEITKTVRVYLGHRTDEPPQNSFSITPFILKRTPKVDNMLKKLQEYVNGIIPLNIDDFEQGDITMSTDGNTYSDYASRARTKRNHDIQLHKGDTIYIPNEVEIYLNVKKPDGTYQPKGWLSDTTYICEYDSYYTFLIRQKTLVTMTDEKIVETLSMITIVSGTEYFHVINTLNETKEKTESLESYLVQPFYANVTPSKTRYIQHKGLISLAPENSLPAFRLAGEHNAWAIECDLYDTSDGELIIMHDGTVDRMTNGSGDCRELTYSEVRSFRIDNGVNVENYSSDELIVPNFEEFLQICKQYGMVGVIEVKGVFESGKRKMIELIRKYRMEDSVIVMLYTRNDIDNFRALAGDRIHVDWLVDINNLTEQAITNLKDYKNIGIQTDYDSTKYDELNTLIRLAQSYGMTIGLFTITSIEQNQSALGLYTDYLTTNLAMNDYIKQTLVN